MPNASRLADPRERGFAPRWWCFANNADPVAPAPEPVVAAAPAPAASIAQPDPAAPSAAAANPAAPVIDPAAPKAGDPKPVVQPTKDWRDQRIAQLTAKLNEAKAKPAAPAAAAPATGEVTVTQDELDRLVAERGTELAQRADFDRQCNAVGAAGAKEFPDFGARLNSLVQLVDKTDEASVGAYNTFLTAAIETGEGHRILHALGGDLNEAMRIMNLPPVKMAVELTKLSVNPVKPLSGAPKPITPVGNKGEVHTEIDPADPERGGKLSTEEWMARRNKQVAARAAR